MQKGVRIHLRKWSERRRIWGPRRSGFEMGEAVERSRFEVVQIEDPRPQEKRLEARGRRRRGGSRERGLENTL
jgi:hypothetical protein